MGKEDEREKVITCVFTLNKVAREGLSEEMVYVKKKKFNPQCKTVRYFLFTYKYLIFIDINIIDI